MIIIKKIKYIIVAFVLLFSLNTVYADKINKITMDIYLDENGNANIKETWDVEADSGTEWYKQLYNMGNEKISNFKVSMDGVMLTEKKWDVNETISEKAGYYGINYVSEGIELCFGKKDYNNHTFTLTYDLSNFIVNVDGNQVLYQTLLPNATLDDFHITVRSYYKFPDTLDVWGFGYGGTKTEEGYTYVKDGIIEMSKSKNYTLKGENVVLLVKFPMNTFNTDNTYDEFHTFEEVLNIAEEGSFQYDYKPKPSIFSIIISYIVSYIIPIIIVIISIITAKYHTKYGTHKIKFLNKTRNVKNAPYFRELPLNKNIFKGYWISCQYGLIKKQTDFLGALLLRWLKNGNIENTTVKKGILVKKDDRAIKLLKEDGMSHLETKLYTMMMEASKDGILESNEFKNWCKINYTQILKWFNDVIDDETINFAKEGLLTEETKTFRNIYVADERMQEYALQVSGLKNFLNEFSNIKERESIDVHLWEEYLMFAQIFGIAEKVAKEFKKLYPDVITDEYYDNVIFIHHISYTGVQAASSARMAAESYSAGGGGFSSGGGGGGSFGGGGSMGGR